MPKFAANLSMLFTEYPVTERFERAAAAGFTAVEYLFPYADDVAELRAAIDRSGVEQILFNLPAGDFAAGDRGMGNDPERKAEFNDGVSRAIEIATQLGVGRVNCLVGKELANVPYDLQWETLKENLALAAS